MKNRAFLFLLIASLLCAALVSCARVPASVPADAPAAEAGTTAAVREITTARLAEKITTMPLTQTTAAEIPGIPDALTEEAPSAPVTECDYLVLVNKTHALPEGWENVVELVETENCFGDTFLLERQTLNHFQKLRKALLADGIQIELYSTYRSVERQKEVRAEIAAENGEDYVKRYVAKPGYSEHHTGLALDASVVDSEGDIVAGDEIFPRVHKRLAEFGFILRYPAGKEDITGFAYEKWHFRYVGVEAAQEIYADGLTLEEYLGEN